MRTRGLVLVATIAVAAIAVVAPAGCGNLSPADTSSTNSQRLTTVPKISGLTLRAAERRLFNDHLRWRVGVTRGPISSQPEPPGIYNSLDDLRVTGQRPAAGTTTERGAVVTIGIPCTRRHPCA